MSVNFQIENFDQEILHALFDALKFRCIQASYIDFSRQLMTALNKYQYVCNGMTPSGGFFFLCVPIFRSFHQ